MPWRRPGFQLGLDIAAIKARHPEAIGCILGGHGITAWGDTSDEAERELALDHRDRSRYIAEHGKAEPFGAGRRRATSRCPMAERRAKAAALAPTIRGLASHDRPMVGHFTDVRRGARLPRHVRAPAARRARHELPRPLPAHQGQADACSTCPPTRRSTTAIARLEELHEQYRADYQAYYDAHATPDSPAIRGADPLIVLVPGVGMFSFGANKQTARVAGEFYVNAINVMRGAEALSTYAADQRRREVPHRVLGARGGQAAAHAEAEVARDPRRARHRRGLRHRQGDRHRASRPRARASSSPTSTSRRRRPRPPSSASTDVAIGVAANVTDAAAVEAAIDEAVLAFGGVDLVVNNAGLSLSKPLLETTEADWDLQHDVMAKGSFLVSKAAARVLIDQGLGGDIVYISSKNSVFAGPNNIAYSATKADQAHQVRLLAVELGEHGIKVNGINPDGVVRGSGHLRRRVGREPCQDLRHRRRRSSASSTPSARSSSARCSPSTSPTPCSCSPARDLGHTTGLHIPVDAGVAAAFLR